MTLRKTIDKILFDLFINRHSRSPFIADIAGSVNYNIVEQEPDDEELLIYTNGSSMFIGSNFQDRSKDDIEFAMLHELYHIALLHTSRRGFRELEQWNKACDYVINNALIRDGYSTEMEILTNPSYDKYSEEQLYEIILKESQEQQQCSSPNGQGSGGGGQGGGGSPNPNGNNQPNQNNNPNNNNNNNNGNSNGNNPSQGNGNGNNNGGNNPNKNKLQPKDIPKDMGARDQAKITSVVQAAASALGEKSVGTLAGNLEQFIKTKDVKEKDWRTHLHDFMETAFGEWTIDYAKPNRRFSEFFIPAWTDDSENIESINFYIDTSGSVSDESVQKYLSEIAYIKSVFKPDRLVIKCFDTQIGLTKVYEQYDELEEMNIIGRGGTSFHCVKEDIEETKPKCAVIFSDMYASPMEVPKHKCGILWIQYADEDNMENHQVKVGKKVHFPTV